MSYPEAIDRFSIKLNKKQDGSVYVVEEEVSSLNGVYEDFLEHDNVNIKSVSVYTGPKLTGEKIDNFILSVPTDTPWKLLIKVYSEVEKLYISYETSGDTVEADDINLVQESITNTQSELERHKNVIDSVITEHSNRIESIETNKTDKTYTDSELLKKADKLNTYSKTETDQRIQNIIGAAPASLDTLKELAEALNNDPNFATNIINQLSSKVDKVTGKQLSTEDFSSVEKNKLAGIEAEANKYVHPSTHPPSIIVQDTNNRFVTDLEKSAWNAKQAALGFTPENLANKGKANGYPSLDGTGKVLLSQIPDTVVTQDELGNAGYGDMLKSVYDTDGDGIVDNAKSVPWSGVSGKPSTFTPSSHTHSISQITNLQATLDAKESPNGAQAKADAAETNAKSYAMNMLAIGSSADPNTTQDSYILTNHVNSPSDGVYWHILTFFYTSKTGNRAQIAVTYNGAKPRLMIRHIYGAAWTAWEEVFKKGPITWGDLKGV